MLVATGAAFLRQGTRGRYAFVARHSQNFKRDVLYSRAPSDSITIVKFLDLFPHLFFFGKPPPPVAWLVRRCACVRGDMVMRRRCGWRLASRCSRDRLLGSSWRTALGRWPRRWGCAGLVGEMVASTVWPSKARLRWFWRRRRQAFDDVVASAASFGLAFTGELQVSRHDCRVATTLSTKKNSSNNTRSVRRVHLLTICQSPGQDVCICAACLVFRHLTYASPGFRPFTKVIPRVRCQAGCASDDRASFCYRMRCAGRRVPHRPQIR